LGPQLRGYTGLIAGTFFYVAYVRELVLNFYALQSWAQNPSKESLASRQTADQDANILTVKIVTQLNNRMGALKIGSVIEILKFTRGFLPRVSGCPESMAILVSYGDERLKDRDVEEEKSAIEE
jgi:hypothetical protein